MSHFYHFSLGFVPQLIQQNIKLPSRSGVKGLLEKRKCALWLSIKNKNVKPRLVFVCRKFFARLPSKEHIQKRHPRLDALTVQVVIRVVSIEI